MTQAAALAIESGPVILLRCHVTTCRRPLAELSLCPQCVRPTCAACLIRGGCKAPECPRATIALLECPQGHPYFPENRMPIPGSRKTRCRPCRQEELRRARAGRMGR